MKKISNLFKICLFLFVFLVLPKNSFAQKFDLLAPTDTLTRGQIVTFTINIDTKGKKLTTTQIGLSYDTKYLEFVNITPGDTFTTISSTPVETGKILITGTEGAGFNGQGVFGYVNLKLIATAAGSTELCTLWSPQVTPTVAPTSIKPTGLPRTGYENPMNIAGSLGVLFAISAGVSFIILKRRN